MIILPYSSALSLAKPPLVSYLIAGLCVFIFYLQLHSSITALLMYEPHSWNPLRMLTSTLAHAGWSALIINLVFLLAFAPAVEVMLASALRYVMALTVIALACGVTYSLVTMGHSHPAPLLGLSGLVMGTIGLTAYLMPQTRIRVFWWYVAGWKILYAPAWMMALIYIALDSLITLSDNPTGGSQIIAHLSAGVTGFALGFLWLKPLRQQTRDELAHEIDQMETQRKNPNIQRVPYQHKVAQEKQQTQRLENRQQDQFLTRIYRLVTTHNDGEAVYLLMQQYDYFNTPTSDYEALFKRIHSWGPSRSLLCMGRLIIQRLHEEKRYGRALYMIEQCQQIRSQFILPDLAHTLFYARRAIEMDKPELARNLLLDPYTRYGDQVNAEICIELLAQISPHFSPE